MRHDLPPKWGFEPDKFPLQPCTACGGRGRPAGAAAAPTTGELIDG